MANINSIKSQLLSLPMRDLGPVLDEVIKDKTAFLSFFTKSGVATNPKHEWLQDTLTARRLTITNVTTSTKTLTASEADVAKLQVGMQFVVENDYVLYEIATIPSTTTFTVTVIAARGKTNPLPAANDVLRIVSKPNVEGSYRADSEDSARTVGTDYNFLQVLRKKVVVTNMALNTKTYDQIENDINMQAANMIRECALDLNYIAIAGQRREMKDGAKGAAGGLYDFGLQDGSLAITNMTAKRLDCFMTNDAAAKIIDAGAEPDIVLCGPGQARVLSNDYRNMVMVDRGDLKRGTYVARIVSDVTGKEIVIVVEPAIPDTEAWVLDTSGLFYVPLQNSDLTDRDTTSSDFEGIERTIVGTFTFEYKNALARLCRISNLSPSATELEKMKDEKPVSVVVNNTIENAGA